MRVSFFFSSHFKTIRTDSELVVWGKDALDVAPDQRSLPAGIVTKKDDFVEVLLLLGRRAARGWVHAFGWLWDRASHAERNQLRSNT